MFHVDDLGDLELAWVERSGVFDVLVGELELFVLDVSLLFIGLLLILFHAGDLSGVGDELDLFLSEDDLAPVDEGLSELVEVLDGSLVALSTVEWSRNLQVVEFLDEAEVDVGVVAFLLLAGFLGLLTLAGLESVVLVVGLLFLSLGWSAHDRSLEEGFLKLVLDLLLGDLLSFFLDFLFFLALVDLGEAILLELLALNDLLIHRVSSKVVASDVRVHGLELLDFGFLQLLLHDSLVLDLSEPLFLLSLFLLLVEPLLLLLLLSDSLLSLGGLSLPLLSLLFADLELVLHVGHPGDVTEEVLLFGVVDESLVVDGPEILLLLVVAVLLVTLLLSLLVDLVQLLVERLLALHLVVLSLLEFLNFGLKFGDLFLERWEAGTEFLLLCVDGIDLLIDLIPLFDELNRVFQEFKALDVLTLLCGGDVARSLVLLLGLFDTLGHILNGLEVSVDSAAEVVSVVDKTSKVLSRLLLVLEDDGPLLLQSLHLGILLPELF